MTESNHLDGIAVFFDKAIKEIAKGNLSFKILDFAVLVSWQGNLSL